MPSYTLSNWDGSQPSAQQRTTSNFTQNPTALSSLTSALHDTSADPHVTPPQHLLASDPAGYKMEGEYLSRGLGRSAYEGRDGMISGINTLENQARIRNTQPQITRVTSNRVENASTLSNSFSSSAVLEPVPNSFLLSNSFSPYLPSSSSTIAQPAKTRPQQQTINARQQQVQSNVQVHHNGVFHHTVASQLKPNSSLSTPNGGGGGRFINGWQSVVARSESQSSKTSTDLSSVLQAPFKGNDCARGETKPISPNNAGRGSASMVPSKSSLGASTSRRSSATNGAHVNGTMLHVPLEAGAKGVFNKIAPAPAPAGKSPKVYTSRNKVKRNPATSVNDYHAQTTQMNHRPVSTLRLPSSSPVHSIPRKNTNSALNASNEAMDTLPDNIKEQKIVSANSSTLHSSSGSRVPVSISDEGGMEIDGHAQTISVMPTVPSPAPIVNPPKPFSSDLFLSFTRGTTPARPPLASSSHSTATTSKVSSSESKSRSPLSPTKTTKNNGAVAIHSSNLSNSKAASLVSAIPKTPKPKVIDLFTESNVVDLTKIEDGSPKDLFTESDVVDLTKVEDGSPEKLFSESSVVDLTKIEDGSPKDNVIDLTDPDDEPTIRVSTSPQATARQKKLVPYVQIPPLAKGLKKSMYRWMSPSTSGGQAQAPLAPNKVQAIPEVKVYDGLADALKASFEQNEKSGSLKPSKGLTKKLARRPQNSAEVVPSASTSTHATGQKRKYQKRPKELGVSSSVPNKKLRLDGDVSEKPIMQPQCSSNYRLGYTVYRPQADVLRFFFDPLPPIHPRLLVFHTQRLRSEVGSAAQLAADARPNADLKEGDRKPCESFFRRRKIVEEDSEYTVGRSYYDGGWSDQDDEDDEVNQAASETTGQDRIEHSHPKLAEPTGITTYSLSSKNLMARDVSSSVVPETATPSSDEASLSSPLPDLSAALPSAKALGKRKATDSPPSEHPPKRRSPGSAFDQPDISFSRPRPSSTTSKKFPETNTTTKDTVTEVAAATSANEAAHLDSFLVDSHSQPTKGVHPSTHFTTTVVSGNYEGSQTNGFSNLMPQSAFSQSSGDIPFSGLRKSANDDIFLSTTGPSIFDGAFPDPYAEEPLDPWSNTASNLNIGYQFDTISPAHLGGLEHNLDIMEDIRDLSTSPMLHASLSPEPIPIASHSPENVELELLTWNNDSEGSSSSSYRSESPPYRLSPQPQLPRSESPNEEEDYLVTEEVPQSDSDDDYVEGGSRPKRKLPKEAKSLTLKERALTDSDGDYGSARPKRKLPKETKSLTLKKTELSDSEDDYGSAHPKRKLPNSPKSLTLKKVGVSVSRKPKGVLPRYCHQCRNNPPCPRMFCSCGKQFCEICIDTRYTDITFAESFSDSGCPLCMGNCNCDFCCKKRGEAYVPRRSTAFPRSKQKLVPLKNPLKNPLENSLKKVEGPAAYWGAVYDINGQRMATGYVGADDKVYIENPLPSPTKRKPPKSPKRRRRKRRIHIGAIEPSWQLGPNVKSGEYKPGRPGRWPKKKKPGQRTYIGNPALMFYPVVEREHPEIQSYDDDPLSPLSELCDGEEDKEDNGNDVENGKLSPDSLDENDVFRAIQLGLSAVGVQAIEFPDYND